MTDRIQKLLELTLQGKRFVKSKTLPEDRMELFLPPLVMQAKRSADYIRLQEPQLCEYQALGGFLCFDGSAMGTIFQREGHEHFRRACENFYCKPIDGLITFGWQHSVADYEKVLAIGLSGMLDEVAASKKQHVKEDELLFLDGVETVLRAIIDWTHIVADDADRVAKETKVPAYKDNLLRLAQALRRVPEYPASSFYEAVLTVYLVYAFVPDSIGVIDRYFLPYYRKDIASGLLTQEQAKEYLQELFLQLQGKVQVDDERFTRGGESHFCIGGYTQNGEDGFTELSKLILDSMLELPTWIPQISLRWTKKTSPDVFRYVLECERKDPNKRIAFVNDEPRIKAFMGCGFSFDLACRYTMVGCNEPQLPGGIFMGGGEANIVKGLEHMLYTKQPELLAAKTFDEVLALYRPSLFETLNRIVSIFDGYQRMRARDVNLVSTAFFEGSVKCARSITQGGAQNATAAMNIFGSVTTVDALTVIKQFVFDEKSVSMETLLDALNKNWEGYGDLHTQITKTAHYFGNGEKDADDLFAFLSQCLTDYFADTRSALGYPFVLGNLIGYNEYNKFMGSETRATPDGRYDGETVSFGVGQSLGRDRNGLAALLASVAKTNAYAINCGSSVTNIYLDEAIVRNDDSFRKLCDLLETYFRMGGLHFQLNYVSKEALIKAQSDPQTYRSLRVRVSGFSDYFVNLNRAMQDEIITRTVKEH